MAGRLLAPPAPCGPACCPPLLRLQSLVHPQWTWKQASSRPPPHLLPRYHHPGDPGISWSQGHSTHHRQLLPIIPPLLTTRPPSSSSTCRDVLRASYHYACGPPTPLLFSHFGRNPSNFCGWYQNSQLTKTRLHLEFGENSLGAF